METLTIEYNAQDKAVKQIINGLLAVGVFHIKDAKSPYNPEFVEKIRKAEKQPSVKVDIDNLWK